MSAPLAIALTVVPVIWSVASAASAIIACRAGGPPWCKVYSSLTPCLARKPSRSAIRIDPIPAVSEGSDTVNVLSGPGGSAATGFDSPAAGLAAGLAGAATGFAASAGLPFGASGGAVVGAGAAGVQPAIARAAPSSKAATVGRVSGFKSSPSMSKLPRHWPYDSRSGRLGQRWQPVGGIGQACRLSRPQRFATQLGTVDTFRP